MIDSFFGWHPVIALDIVHDFFYTLPGFSGDQGRNALADEDYLARLNLNIRCLTPNTAARLVNQKPGIG